MRSGELNSTKLRLLAHGRPFRRIFSISSGSVFKQLVLKIRPIVHDILVLRTCMVLDNTWMVVIESKCLKLRGLLPCIAVDSKQISIGMQCLEDFKHKFIIFSSDVKPFIQTLKQNYRRGVIIRTFRIKHAISPLGNQKNMAPYFFHLQKMT